MEVIGLSSQSQSGALQCSLQKLISVSSSMIRVNSFVTSQRSLDKSEQQ